MIMALSGASGIVDSTGAYNGQLAPQKNLTHVTTFSDFVQPTDRLVTLRLTYKNNQ